MRSRQHVDHTVIVINEVLNITPKTPVSNLVPLSLSCRLGLHCADCNISILADLELFATQSSAGSLDNHVAVRGDWVGGNDGLC